MIWLIQFYFRCRQTGLRQPVSRGKRPFRTTSKTPSANALRIGPEAAPPRPSAAVSAAIVIHPIPTAGTAKEPNNLRRHTLRSEGVKKLQILRRGYWAFRKIRYLCPANGGLAQLARALAWHARGHEFESRILHQSDGDGSPAKYSFAGFYIFESNATKCRQTHITRSLFGAPCVSEKTGRPNKDSMRCIT